MRLNRRQSLAAAATLTAAAVLPASFVTAQTAPRPFQKFDLGNAELHVIHDGIMDVAAAGAASNRPEAEVDTALAAAGFPKGRIRQPINVAFLKTATDLIAIDTGSGPNFLDGLGKMPDNLAAAGLDAKSVTKVIFTHGHPDHLWGAIDEFDDSLRFPNARYFMSEIELDLWRSPDAEKKLPSDRTNFVPGARRNIKGLGDRLATFKPESEVIPGVFALSTRGHTQGHVSFEFRTKDGPLVILGDALIHPLISFAHPDWQPSADHEPDVAAAMRKRLLDRLATDKAQILGYHLPAPGLGRVEKSGTTYRFISA